MVKLTLNEYVTSIHRHHPCMKAFPKPFIYYLVSRNDNRPFFITFVIVNLNQSTITYLSTYHAENIQKIEATQSPIYEMKRCVHCTLEIIPNKEFITFMEEECFFFHVNREKKTLSVYTMNDLIQDNHVDHTRISSTFYKGDDDPTHFYMSAVDTRDHLYIYRVAIDLSEAVYIDDFYSNPWPPHVMRKRGSVLYVSNEFRFSKYLLENKGQVLSGTDLHRLYIKNVQSIELISNTLLPNDIVEQNGQFIDTYKRDIFTRMRNRYSIKCLPGKILLIDLKTKEKIYYETSGGSPAHFEFDDRGYVYTSSHNFMNIDATIFYEPGTIDKFKINGTMLEHVGAFCYGRGYRYTTHKIFVNDGIQYIVTFGEPNRLCFIKTDTMELVYYYDVNDDDLLSDNDDISLFINSRANAFSYLAIQVSDDGEIIIFLDNDYLYFFSFKGRCVIEKIPYRQYRNEEFSLDDYVSRTAHIDFLC